MRKARELVRRIAGVVGVVAITMTTHDAAAVERGGPGERLVYSELAGGCSDPAERDLVVSAADGGEPDVIATCAVAAGPASPDGERLTASFFSHVDSPAHVTESFTVALSEDDGCRSGLSVGSEVSWSPDGVRVAAAMHDSSMPSRNGLWISDTRTGTQRQLVSAPGVRWPSWSPLGAPIAFTIARAAGDHDIDLVFPDGRYRRTILGGATDDMAPAIAPDGQSVAFVRRDGEELFVHHALIDGSGATRVSPTPVIPPLSWTASGDELLVALEDGLARMSIRTGAIARVTTGDHRDPDQYERGGQPGADGYTLLGSHGTAYRFGAACPDLSRDRIPERPYVAAAATPTRDRAWYVTAEGRVEPTGSTPLLGDAPPGLRAPIVGMAASPSGGGYWLVAGDGGIFSFGDAAFHGSTGALRLNEPIVGMAASPSGGGYWLVARDGGIFTFGDAAFYGSTGALRLNQPIVAVAPTVAGDGYWLAAVDGGVFTFGSARFHGSVADLPAPHPIIAILNRGPRRS